MDFLLEGITKWLKEVLVGGIVSNLTGMFDSTNQQVGQIAGQVGLTPQAWNGGIFNMIQSLSNNVILPIAGLILAIVMTLELIQLITDKNNLNDVDTWMFFKDDQYPLVEWGITEAQALQICYDRGFDFGGLYEIYHRCSCWCCPFQRIGELRKLRKHHPELWQKLLEMDRRARAQFGPGPLGQFKKDWSVDRLEERFAKEDS